MYRCCMVLAAKGGKLADLSVGDVLELFNAEDRLGVDVRSRPALFKVIREMGVFRPDVPAWRALRRYGQLERGGARRPPPDRLSGYPGPLRRLLGRAPARCRLRDGRQALP